MAGRERRPASPKCPQCGGTEVDALASDEKYHRYQCKSIKCLHGPWTVPRVPDLAAAIGRPRLYRASEEEVLSMGNKDLAPSEACMHGCGLSDFKTPRSKGQHERYCQGKKGKDAKEEAAPDRPARRTPPLKARQPELSPEIAAARPGAPSPSTGLIQIISAVPEHLQGTPAGETLAHLLRQKQMLEAEALAINESLRVIVRHSVAAESEPAFRKIT